MEAAGENQPESRYVLKVGLTGFTMGLDVEEGGGKEGTKNDSGVITSAWGAWECHLQPYEV